MLVDAGQKKKVLQMVEDCGCNKACTCADSDFEDVAPVRHLTGSNLLECYTEKAKGCKFGLPFGGTYFCRCPVRSYIKRELNI